MRGSSWAFEREKGQYRTGQEKVTKGLYVTYVWKKPPLKRPTSENCVACDVIGIITCAKFQNKIFRGYDFTGG